MMNFAIYSVTVNAPSYEIDGICKAIEACGLYILELNGVRRISEGSYECFGCFIKQRKRGH